MKVVKNKQKNSMKTLKKSCKSKSKINIWKYLLKETIKKRKYRKSWYRNLKKIQFINKIIKNKILNIV